MNKLVLNLAMIFCLTTILNTSDSKANQLRKYDYNLIDNISKFNSFDNDSIANDTIIIKKSNRNSNLDIQQPRNNRLMNKFRVSDNYDPYNNNVFIRLEQAQQELERYNLYSAKQQYKEILAKHPQNKNALFGLALAYHKSEQFDKAEQQYRITLSYYPHYKDAMDNYITLIVQQYDHNYALKSIKNLIKRAPKYAHLYFVLAQLHFGNKEIQHAIDNIETAIVLSPSNSKYRKAMANLMSYIGQKNYAMELQQQAKYLELKENNKTSNLDTRVTFSNYNREVLF